MTDMEWVEQNCGTCAFNIDGLCRVRPPSRQSRHFKVCSMYPYVRNGTLACYLWRRKNDGNQNKKEN